MKPALKKLFLSAAIALTVVVFMAPAAGLAPTPAFAQTKTVPTTPAPATPTTPTTNTPPPATPTTPTTNTSPSTSKSNLPNFYDCTTNLASCGLYFAMYAANSIGGLGINLAASLVRFGLDMDSGITQSSFVQTGFSVTLGITNLIFVLLIIIIALATMIRNESYGVKQALWKLVVMAILVNFGLVITAPVLSLADATTSYFITAIQTSASSGTTVADQGETLSSALATAFKVQAFQLSPMTQEQAEKECTPQTTLNLNSAMAPAPDIKATAQDIQQCITLARSRPEPFTSDAFISNLGNLAAGLAMTWIAAWTFLVIGVLLLIRYAVLTLLLVVLPLAWVLWVFPDLSKNFHKWWSEFIKWTFFPSVTIFFIYLAFIVYLQMAAGRYAQALLPAGASIGPEGAISQQLGYSGTSVIKNFLNLMVMTFLMIGGIMTALSLTSKAGDSVVKGVNSASKGVTKWAGRKSGTVAARTGRLAYQKAGGHELTDRLRKSNIMGVSSLGRGLAKIQTNKKEVEEAKKKVPKTKEEVLANLEGYMSKQDRMAHLSTALEKGWVKADTKVGGKTVGEWVDENHDVLKRYGSESVMKDTNKALMSNKDIRASKKAIQSYNDAIKNGTSEEKAKKLLDVTPAETEIKDAQGNPVQKVDARVLLDKATESLVEKTEDLSKVDPKHVFGKKEAGSADDEAQSVLMEKLAKNDPRKVRRIMGKLAPDQIATVKTKFEPKVEEAQKEIDESIKSIEEEAKTALSSEEKQELADVEQSLASLKDTKAKLKDLQKASKRIGNRTDLSDAEKKQKKAEIGTEIDQLEETVEKEKEWTGKKEALRVKALNNLGTIAPEKKRLHEELHAKKQFFASAKKNIIEQSMSVAHDSHGDHGGHDDHGDGGHGEGGGGDSHGH